MIIFVKIRLFPNFVRSKSSGEQEKYPAGVAHSVELALFDYAEILNNPMMSRMMQMNKPKIIEAILIPSDLGESETVSLSQPK